MGAMAIKTEVLNYFQYNMLYVSSDGETERGSRTSRPRQGHRFTHIIPATFPIIKASTFFFYDS